MNEEQRQRIVAALAAYDKTNPLTEEELQDPDLEYLLPCLEELPKTEAESPGITHGICL